MQLQGLSTPAPTSAREPLGATHCFPFPLLLLVFLFSIMG